MSGYVEPDLPQDVRDHLLLYWSGELDLDACEALERALVDHSEWQRYLRELEELTVTASETTVHCEPRSDILNEALNRAFSGIQPEPVVVPESGFRSKWFLGLAAAASVCLGIFIVSRLVPQGGGPSDPSRGIAAAQWDAELDRTPATRSGSQRALGVFRPSDSEVAKRLSVARWEARELRNRIETL